MSQITGSQQILRRLAMMDEAFVEGQAGLGLGLAGTPALDSKTVALLQLGAAAANGSNYIAHDWAA